jgi:hypothetical protein
VAVALLSAPAAAQEDAFGFWEVEVRPSLGVLADLSGGPDPSLGLPHRELGVELGLSGSATAITDSGIEWGVAGQLRAVADGPARLAQTGGLPACPVSVPGCPTRPSRGAGLVAGLEGGAEAALLVEQAYAFVRHPLGEVRVGRDAGVALRLGERAPDVFVFGAAGSPRLDPAGSNGVRVAHDLTGPAPKVSLTSRRLFAVRGGVSFTPEADSRGADFAPVPGRAPLEDVTEIALQASHLFRTRADGVRVSASVARSEADSREGSVGTWSAGAVVEPGDWSFGVAWRQSEDEAAGAGRYTATEAGLTRRVQLAGLPELTLGLTAAEAEDTAARLSASSWRAGVGLEVAPNWRLALGWAEDQLESAVSTGGHGAESVTLTTRTTRGPRLELRFTTD